MKKQTKNYVIVTMACVTCFLFVATIMSVLNVFNRGNLKAATKSATETKDNYLLNLIGRYKTKKYSTVPNVIQGSVGYNGRIYFAMSNNKSKAGGAYADKEEFGNNFNKDEYDNFNTYINNNGYSNRTYVINKGNLIVKDKDEFFLKNVKSIKKLDKFYKKNSTDKTGKVYKTYKSNDMTANVVEKKSGKKELIIYSLAMDANHNLSKRNGSILLSYNISTNDYKEYSFKSTNPNCQAKDVYNKDTKESEKKDICDEFTNIGYNVSNKKFYSLFYQTKDIYNYSINESSKNIIPSKLCSVSSIYYDKSGRRDRTLNASEKFGPNNNSYYRTIYQGITMRGYLMYVPYQREKVVNGDIKEETNYVAVYDTRNCKKGNVIDYSKTIRIGSRNNVNNKVSDDFELESLFFMGGKLHLAYNNYGSTKISFYTLNFSDDVIKITNASAKRVGSSVQLTAKIKSEYKMYAYKICDNEDGTNCKYNGIMDKSSGNYLTPSEYNLDVSIDEMINYKKLYLFVRDLYGNTKLVSINIK